MSKIFCIPGIVFLLVALIVSFLASISLPYLPTLDITRVEFTPSLVENEMTNLRFGIWTSCYYNEEEDKTCQKNGYAYEVDVSTADGAEQVVIGSSWTRGLVVQPLATAVTLVALCLSLSTNLFVALLASLVSFLAAIMHLISFAIQIALFAYVKKKMNDLDIDAKTKVSPGFWLVFASLLLTLLGGCTVCFGRRRDKAKKRAAATAAAVEANPAPAADTAEPAATDEKPKSGFLSRFRKN
ncbi:hypothetical protein CC1G_09101 [Coprinopsis cinerea okayama7|uniref:Pali-domain-containing protein n=1 Tax=Coprinopsis cinerea (strain Okayama-7 / 130 / ATCC MYA-4618 / FGSC 9003) TaxID=240176 RepID=A8NJ46_COPC7|nr:hypothetical protein CC1G_09101 [Coprinopsis cinerea okayama7\|eukprot:XP_001834144.1 hypothetical protein CC1G_09101 [Coprinopsis cinerea okayama7\